MAAVRRRLRGWFDAARYRTLLTLAVVVAHQVGGQRLVAAVLASEAQELSRRAQGLTREGGA